MAFCTEGLQFDPLTDPLPANIQQKLQRFLIQDHPQTKKRILTCQHPAPCKWAAEHADSALGQQFYHWPQEHLTGLSWSHSNLEKRKLLHKQDRTSPWSLRSFSCPTVLRGHTHWKAWLLGTQPLCPYTISCSQTTKFWYLLTHMWWLSQFQLSSAFV